MWLLAAPLGLTFSARILWEKTLLTAEQGEQMVGFSLGHIHPMFFIIGALCSLVLLIWFFGAMIYAVRARFRLFWFDYVMIASCLIVILAAFLPDNFGMKFR